MKLTPKQKKFYDEACENGYVRKEDLDKAFKTDSDELLQLKKLLKEENYSIYTEEEVELLNEDMFDDDKYAEFDKQNLSDDEEEISEEELEAIEEEAIDELEEQNNKDNLSSEFEVSEDEANLYASESFDDLLYSQRSQVNQKISVSDPVKMYLKEIGMIPLLTVEEEREIAKTIYDNSLIVKEFDEKYGRGDVPPTPEEEENRNKAYFECENAKKRLTEANLRLVVNIAKHFSNPDMQFADLIQEGSMGLAKAVIKFDYTRGNKFSTYATGWIKQAITRAIADQARTIRIPVHMNETINKINKKERELRNSLGRTPSDFEIAQAMDMTEQKLAWIKSSCTKPKSLEDPVGEEDDSTYGDFVSDKNCLNPEEYTAQEALKKEIDSLLSTLSEREERVIRMRFGLEDGRNRTLEEVGREFGVTRERIRQIEAKALRKLRHPSKKNKIQDYIK